MFFAVVLMLFGLRMVSGETISFVRLVASFQFWIALLLVPGVVLFFSSRDWWIGGAMAALMLLLILPYLFLFLPGRGISGEPVALTIMSYNTYARNKNPDAVARVILDAHPDLVLLQEVASPEKIIAKLSDLYNGDTVHVLREPSMMLMIVSRFALTNRKSEGSAQNAIVHLPQGDLYVWNLHAPKTYGSAEKQYKFVESLMSDVRMVKASALVAGDFNATEQSSSYKYIDVWMSNAHERAGFGLGATFPASGRRLAFLPPLIRIDHIFYTGPMKALEAEVLSSSGGSDHTPIVARFSWSAPDGKLSLNPN